MADPLNIPPNRLQRQLERLQEVPSFLRPWVRNLVCAVPCHSRERRASGMWR
jgi:hypothetical protein